MKNPKVGNVVRLKSGGFNMTIETVEADKPVYCTWFDWNGILQHSSFDKCVLKQFKCKKSKKSKNKKKK